jgi:cob(I)alamin adenosyltransferase
MAEPLFTTSREAIAFLRKIAAEYSGTQIQDVLAQLDIVELGAGRAERHQVEVYDKDDLLHCETCGIDEMNANLEVRHGGWLCDNCADQARREWRHQITNSWGNV